MADLTSSPTPAVLPDARALIDRLTHNIETQRVLVEQTAPASVEREAARLAYAVMRDARAMLLATSPASDAPASGAGTYCANCTCDACRRSQQRVSMAGALAKDSNSRCWSCSCGWTGCYTQSDIAKYGEPSECNLCCRESLVECDPPLAAAPKVASDTGADLCHKDGQPCYVGGDTDDAHHRCGTVQCGMLKASDTGAGLPYRSACTCFCHKWPGIMHIAPCCRPDPATDATDGATGGGELRLCPSDAERMREVWADLGDHLGHEAVASTTPGGDLLEQAERRGAELTIAYHVAICSPKGVVPDDRFYDPAMAAQIQASLDAGIPLRALSARNQTDDGGEK